MTRIKDPHQELITQIARLIDQKLVDQGAKLIKDFLQQYYLSVSIEDLKSSKVLDLYGALVSHWQFVYKRLPGETKIRVFNPKVEQHGWQSSHTVIQIAHDNIPFLVDSIRMAINREDINIHLIIHAAGINVTRDQKGIITKILPTECKKSKDTISEAPIYIEIDRQGDSKKLEHLKVNLLAVLKDIGCVVEDWQAMQEKAVECSDKLNIDNLKIDKKSLQEAKEFLKWLAEDNFTFIGYAEYKLIQEGGTCMEYIPKSGYGVLSDKDKFVTSRKFCEMSTRAKEEYAAKKLLMIGKTNTLSSIHRPAYTDFISIKQYDKGGNLSGEKRFIGLYTANAYNMSSSSIPLLRQKLEAVFKKSNFSADSHNIKTLANILETLPRDDLFHATEQELYELAIGIFHLQERHKIKLFIRRDIFGRYFSCLVFVPKENFDSQLRLDMQEILQEELQGSSVEFATRFSESILARIHFLIRVDPLEEIGYNVEDIENKLIQCAKVWQDYLYEALVEHCGEERGNELLRKYGKAFPASYIEAFNARTAVIDIDYFEKLFATKCDDNELSMSLYRPIEDTEISFRLKLFSIGDPINLSDVVPILENMGLKIINERPYSLKLDNKKVLWINDYKMMYPQEEHLNLEFIKETFQEAFNAIWQLRAENDGFNKLVLIAHLTWREVVILRAYYKYLWQIGFGFSQHYVEDALYANPILAKKLVKLFKIKFKVDDFIENKNLQQLFKEIEHDLEHVSNLNEDRILRSFAGVINASIRTNYYKNENYLSFKFESAKVPDLPKPVPLYEIFVYSPEIEGIHLRAAKVARGGIRWSDRREDFRTEILGLMKAQQVKNAVIVPMGAKGGFVIKSDLHLESREKRQEVAINCYKIFIKGLLDLTDNIENGEIIKPAKTMCFDEDDSYLVVAADKGTATFSDIANEISNEYNFWLKDAFASGGSTGYDHKKMGITARGAFESVKMHFQRMNIDVLSQPITVIGVGDMAGDVFGNGMLLSKTIKLVAAFNHMHIFIDPNPEPSVSYNERKRLFELPRSSWEDYDQSLISKGGGIFFRSAKFINITPEIKNLLQITEDKLLPNELISYILQAKVDLFWNGGIGTFAKASYETNAEVGDRSNDAIRIDANNLRAKVVGEGGNLGLTQNARIEYALQGGIVNTDAIDNSAGVNCSDNEVSIKILLNEAVASGDITQKQRDQLLIDMGDEVANLVLVNNQRQNDAITLAEMQAANNLDMHSRLLDKLEKAARLDREIEFLPGKEEIINRKANKQGFTRPEIAVLMAYTKIFLKEQLLSSNFPEDPFVNAELIKSFPTPLQNNYQDYMCSHKLKREIIATQISNDVIDEMGINFIHRLQDETGGAIAEIVRCYMVSREVFDFLNIKQEIFRLSGTVDYNVLLKMLQELNRLTRRATRWFLRNRRGGLDIAETITTFKPQVFEVSSKLQDVLQNSLHEEFVKEMEILTAAKVPKQLSCKIGSMSAMFSSLDIVEAAKINKFTVMDVATVYFSIGAKLKLGWFRELIKSQPINNHWEALARAAFRDDVDRQQRNLAVGILKSERANKCSSIENCIETWIESNKALLSRWEFFVAELQHAKMEFTMFAVALRELLDLSHVITHSC